MNTNKTIELVGYGHPDRFADYIAEKILTECLKQDKTSKVAIEVLATKDSISLGGELTTNAIINYEELVHNAIDIIYGEQWWPNYKDVKVYNHISKQSPELEQIQISDYKIVAGDQGVIYGYYNKERYSNIKWLYSIMDKVKSEFNIANDWKLLFNEKELSMSVCGSVNHKEIKTYIETFIDSSINVIINPKGTWLMPGPLADTGVVGRKLMIDTFGAGVPHGGGAFCGKDPSKVDKTGIIIASKLAKEISEANNIPEVIVELNYKIGDEIPKAFAHYDNSTIEVSDKINLSLNEFIDKYSLLNEEWSEYVIKGGVISYLEQNIK